MAKVKKDKGEKVETLEDDPTEIWSLLDDLTQRNGFCVYKVYHKKNKVLEVLKKFQVNHQTENEDPFKACLEIANSWHQSRHKHIVNVHDIKIDHDYLWLTCEYMSFGNIRTILNSGGSFVPLLEPHVSYITKCMLSALEFLHSRNLVLSSFSSSSILVGDHGTCKLKGLDITRMENLSAFHEEKELSTYFWTAPELLTGKETQPSFASNIWSLGITIIEICQGAPPMFGLSKEEFISMITMNPDESPGLRKPEIWSKDISDILKKMLAFLPSKRNKATELLQHNWLKRSSSEASFSSECIKRVGSKLALLQSPRLGSENDTNNLLESFLLGKSVSSYDGYDESTDAYTNTITDTSNELKDPESAVSDTKSEFATPRSKNPIAGSVGSIDIGDLALAMSDAEFGVSVKNRYYHLRKYKKCFVGSEAVDWICESFNITERSQAVELGKSMMARGFIEHVCSSEPFEDAYYFYRFVAMGQGSKIVSGKKGLHPLQASQSSNKEKKRRVAITSKELLQFTEVEINKLKMLMLDPEDGLEIKDRRWHLKKYSNCFVGEEAVTWLKARLNLTDDADALQLGQLMIDRGVFHHVSNDQPFRNDYKYYRFYCHEKNRFREDKQVNRKKAKHERKRSSSATNQVNRPRALQLPDFSGSRESLDVDRYRATTNMSTLSPRSHF